MTTSPTDVVTGTPLLDAATFAPGPVPYRGGPGMLVPEIADSGLTGRGGAAFPVARKLAAVAAAGGRGRAPVVVANGAEGEPASAKDAFLLTHALPLVCDGLQLAAEAVGADRAYLHVPTARVAELEHAVAGRRSDRVRIRLSGAADHFLSGEESAVVSAVDGHAGLPRDKAVRVTERGVAGRPTLVQNVETLAHLGLIAHRGAGWFRNRGTDDEPGTMLVTISGAAARPGVLEVPLGTPLPEVLDRAGATPDSAVLVGGFHGAWLAPDEVERAALSRASLSRFGAAPGAGVLLVLPAGASGLAESARIVGYLAGASARQCVACVNGLPAMADVLARLAAGERDTALVARCRTLADRVTGRGACHHPDGTARLVRSALRVFIQEWT